MKFPIISVLLPHIKNMHAPICINCIHFIEYKNNYPYDYVPTDKLGNCSKFGNKHLITGEIEYSYAYVVRNDEKKCGEKGKYFQERTSK